VAISAFVVTRLGVEKLGRTVGLCIGFAYAVSWGIDNAVASQFHEIALALPLLALSLAALVRGRWRTSALWAAPLVFVKEDLGLTVLVIGVVLALRGARRLGAALCAWGIFWFAATTLLILPLLNPHGTWDYGGSSNVGGSLLHLGDTLASLVTTQKFETIILLTLATAGLAFRSPLSLAVLPTLAWRFLAGNEAYWGPAWHYSAVLMPIVFVALIDALLIARRSRRPWLRVYGRITVPITLAFALAMLPQQPLAELAQPESYAPPPRAAVSAMAAIPDGATVASDLTYLAYLANRDTVYWLGNPGNPAADYLILDRNSGSWSGSPPTDAAAFAEQSFTGTTYQLVYSRDGYQLAKRVG
jgi:uncharacterized membrane protein